jgi:hypothetical protein
MSKRPFDPRRDGGALLLFVAGTLVSVLMVLVLTSDGPLSSYSGTAALAEPFVNSFGAWATLLFAAGMAFVGARTFLIQGEAFVFRHALGLTGLLIGTASVFGAFEERAGGLLGALIGGQLASATHPMVGALAGAAIAAGIGWYVWLRPEDAGDAPEEVRQSLGGKAAADTGVSREEAAGLVPADLEAALEAGRRALAQQPVPIASPYPEDVRLRGEIPAGAKPLEVNTGRAVPLEAKPERKPLPEGVQPLFAEPSEVEEEAESAELEGDLGEPAPLPSQPSWETTGLSAEDEPVDAYGTPLSVIKAVRPEGDEPPLVEPVSETPIQPVWETGSTALLAEFDQLEEEVLELQAAVDAVTETESELEAPVLEDELETQPVFEDEPEVLTPAAGEAAIEDESAPEPESESESAPEPEPAPARAPIAQTTIFDFAPAEESLELFPEEAARIAEQESEPQVVLQPQPVPEARAHKLPAIDPERARLLREIGCLFVENGRVAVSMLQRKYSMEFDDACKVLDELQELGLIGPYLGGQRRDILLSREQWLEKVRAD